MPVDLQETRLPGVGVKYAFPLALGGRIAVIQHNDGQRDVYYYRRAATTEPHRRDRAARRRGTAAGRRARRRLRAPEDRRGPRAGSGRAQHRVGPGARRQPSDRQVARGLFLSRADGRHGDRDPPRARAGERRAARRRRSAGRHARCRGEGGPVQRVPPAKACWPKARSTAHADAARAHERVDRRAVGAVDRAQHALCLHESSPGSSPATSSAV